MTRKQLTHQRLNLSLKSAEATSQSNSKNEYPADEIKKAQKIEISAVRWSSLPLLLTHANKQKKAYTNNRTKERERKKEKEREKTIYLYI